MSQQCPRPFVTHVTLHGSFTGISLFFLARRHLRGEVGGVYTASPPATRLTPPPYITLRRVFSGVFIFMFPPLMNDTGCLMATKIESMSCNPDCPVQTQIRPPARNGKNWPKNGFWPHREKEGKNGRKMGPKMAIFPFCGHFPPFFPVGSNSAFFFPISGRRPEFGS